MIPVLIQGSTDSGRDSLVWTGLKYRDIEQVFFFKLVKNLKSTERWPNGPEKSQLLIQMTLFDSSTVEIIQIATKNRLIRSMTTLDHLVTT